ncbi:MAG: cutinase family protein, partial [Actinomycetes bacterium]
RSCRVPSTLTSSSAPTRVDTFELGDLDADGVLDPGGYPAVPGGRMPGIDTRANPQRELQIIGGYNESTRVGAEELVSVLGTLHDRCPDQVFVVAGISQGADATMKGLQRLPDELTRRIAAVHVFGDPGFVVGPWMVAPRTRIPSGHGILGPRVPYVPDALRSRTTSWCGQFDGVCTGQFWLAILDAIEDCPKHRDLPICSARHTDYGYWAFGDAALQAATAAINSLR